MKNIQTWNKSKVKNQNAMAADKNSTLLVNTIFKKSTQGILAHLYNMTPRYKGNPSCHYSERVQVQKKKKKPYQNKKESTLVAALSVCYA